MIRRCVSFKGGLNKIVNLGVSWPLDFLGGGGQNVWPLWSAGADKGSNCSE